MRIRFAIIAAPLLLLASTSGAGAQNYPWCAQYNMWGGGGRNCGFVSWQQCMATVSGVGGYCEQNAMYQPGSAEVQRKTRRHMR
jgi:hypothetical protein